MEKSEVLTLVIAVWGAMLSTLLAFRESKKDRKQIKIFVDFILFYRYMNIVVVNSGHRPVEISDIALGVYTEGEPNGFWQYYDHFSILPPDLKPLLPAMLNDGESTRIPIHGRIVQDIERVHMKIRIQVYDSEGKSYYKYQIRHIDPRYRSHYWEGTNIDMNPRKRVIFLARARYEKFRRSLKR